MGDIELSDATSRAARKVVVLLFGRDCLRADECLEVTFDADLDTSSDSRRYHGYVVDTSAVGLRILDGDAQPVAREINLSDRVAAESDAADFVEHDGVLERWVDDERDSYSLACGGV